MSILHIRWTCVSLVWQDHSLGQRGRHRPIWTSYRSIQLAEGFPLSCCNKWRDFLSAEPISLPHAWSLSALTVYIVGFLYLLTCSESISTSAVCVNSPTHPCALIPVWGHRGGLCLWSLVSVEPGGHGVSWISCWLSVWMKRLCWLLMTLHHADPNLSMFLLWPLSVHYIISASYQ